MDKQPPLRVMMLGLRGFPDVQGGIEKHAENLCPLLAGMGCDVEVIVRSPYQPHATGEVWKGVRFRPIWSPRSQKLETFVHSFLGVVYAAIRRPDILHIQAIGPALMTPLARLLGLRVIVTHHGPDYDRQKWGRLARFVLRMGEHVGMRYSNKRVAISNVILKLVQAKHRVACALIPNGVVPPLLPETRGVLEEFGLERGRYVLMVGRLVQEKRHLDLIDAFAQAGIPGWKLVLVGAADHSNEYTELLHRTAQATSGVVMTGFQTGVALQELYAHAGFFVLPSSHEGLPIALLEALSYGLPVIASNIPANLEVALAHRHYFPLGNIEALASALREFSQQPCDEAARALVRESVSRKYDWKAVAVMTMQVYQDAIAVQPDLELETDEADFAHVSE